MITYEINEDRTRLTLIADGASILTLVAIKRTNPEFFETIDCELLALDQLIVNSDLFWIKPEEIGALTNAPILGFADPDGEPNECWAYMNYQVRSFLDDLITDGKAIFVSSN